ncbi:MAG: hypothetical protein M1840_004728 [Geoglossum simile]|nr:MAG: hypothetical protein M1840_004728 [Geoglossum simile]
MFSLAGALPNLKAAAVNLLTNKSLMTTLYRVTDSNSSFSTQEMVSAMSKEQPKLLHAEAGNTRLTFPPSDHLIVTTRRNVYSWSSSGLTDLFRSGSGGIVAAKKATDGSDMLAVADSQVVVLHDIGRAMEMSYRLKGGDGYLRLLKYTNDSKNLFFTTSLQNSVQSYSLKQSCLLDPSHDHPSPPTCLALSPTSHMLLSCSASPPTIYLQNMTLRTAPLNLRPSVSSAAATVASFHPGRPNIFLLAFADGALAAYDATRLFRDGGKGGKRLGPVGSSIDGEIAHICGTHALGTSTVLIGLEEQIQPGGIGNKATGLTAAEFVPGFRARVISVGADGKCVLVDFEGGSKKKGVVLKTWHVRAPATSVSILQVSDAIFLGKVDGVNDHSIQKRRERPAGAGQIGEKGHGKPCLVAVGRVDGKVMVFNLSGVLLSEKTINPDGGPVIGVEWAVEAVDEGHQRKDERTLVPAKCQEKKQPPNIPARRLENRMPLGRRKRKSMSSILAAGRDVEEEIFADPNEAPQPEKGRPLQSIATDESPVAAMGSPNQSAWQDVAEPPAPDYMSLFSPIKQKTRRWNSQIATLPLVRRRKAEAARVEELLTLEMGDDRSTVSAPLLATEEVASSNSGGLSVPQGPAPRESRRIPTRGAISKSSRSPSRAAEGDGKLLAEIRHARGNEAGSRGNGFALFAPYMQNKVVREQVNSSQLHSPHQPTAVVNHSEPVGDIWLTDASGNEGSRPRTRRKAVQKSSESASNIIARSRKTVSFQPPSKLSPNHKLSILRDTPERIKCQPAPSPRPSGFHWVSAESSYEDAGIDDPLTEMSHNLHSPTKDTQSSTPKRHSSIAATPARFPQNNPSHCCASHSHFREEVAKLHEEMRLFQMKMVTEFEAQKRWFEEIVAGERKASEGVREENERLRRELFEVVRTEVKLGGRRE